MRWILTFGKESYMFHVTILTFRNFGGRDSFLPGDMVWSLTVADVGELWVEGNKACNRRANTLAKQSESGRVKVG